MSGNRFSVPLLALVVLTFAFLLLPLLIVLLMAFSHSESLSFPPQSFSLRWFRAFFHSDSYWNALVHVSIPLGLASCAVATLFGSAAALAVTRLDFPGRGAVQAAILSPLFVPHILLGAAFYVYFTRIGLAGGMVSLVASHSVIGIPFVVHTVTAGLVGIDHRLEEAAVALGASRLQAFAMVTLPIGRSSIASGALFAFVASFSDVNVSLFVSGAGFATVPVQIFSQLQFESDPTIAAASAVQIVCVGVLVLLMGWLGGRR